MAAATTGNAWLKALVPLPQHAVLALAATIGIVLTAVVASGLQRAYDDAIEAAGSKTQNLVRVLEEHARQSLRRVELLLSQATETVLDGRDAGSGDPAALRRELRALLPTDRLIRAFLVVDRDGSIVLSTLSEDVQGLPAVADRDYFTAQRERAGLGMVIGTPVKSRVTGTWTLPVSRRLAASDGAFQGVLLASVDPAHFQRFYDSIDTGANGFVTMFQRQGWIVVRSPIDEKLLQRNWADSPMFRARLPASDVSTVRQVVLADGVERIYSYRVLKEFPVIVTLGLSLTDVLAPWRTRVWRDGSLLALVLAVLAGAAWAISQQLRRREAAEKELRRLSAIVESSSDLIAITGNDHRYLYMNPAARRWAGIGPDEDVSRYKSQQFYDPEHWSFVQQVARPAAIRDGIWSGENRMRAPDGRTVVLSRVLIAHRDARGRPESYSGISRDMTERKLREDLLAGEKQVLQLIAANEPLERILAELLRLLEAQAPGMLCSVLLVDGDGAHLRHGAAPSLPEDYTRAIDGIAIGENVGSCGTAALRREPVYVEDIATDPLWADYRELALRHALRACWCTPIFDSQRRLLGTFAMYYRQPARPTAQHEWLIGIATDMAAIAIVRQQADAELHEREERFRSLVNLSQDLFWETDAEHRFVQQLFSPGSTIRPRPESEIGKTRWEIPYVAPDEDAWRRHRETLDAHLPFRNFELGRPEPDGSVRYVQVSGEPVYDRNGAFTGYRGVSSNITERKRTEEALRRQNERLQIAQGAARMIVVDWYIPEDRLEFSDSPLWLRGPLPEGAKKYPLFKDQVHADDRALFLAARTRAIETLQGQRPEFRFVRTDGEILWLRAHQTVVADAGGKATRLIAAMYDITEQKRAEAQLVALNAELEAKVATRTKELAQALETATVADRMKSDFMANVTHELRTPLNAIIGFAELLHAQLAGPLTDKQTGFAADILAGGQRLLAQVEGILQMSRLDVGGAALAREPVRIGAALTERIEAHRAAALGRGIAIQLDVASDTGDAELDPRALRRMLDALLDNAIRFSREGGAVQVSARSAGGWIEIAVADRGIGMSPEDLAKLFKPFVQLDAGRTRRHGGIGLGLALARRLAELHGGTIDVDSEAGRGSRFTLRVPARETP